MPLEIVRNAITKMKTDAIVNAANSGLKMGGGVCGSIFHAAGSQALQEACDRIGHCAVGETVYTEAFSLDAEFIIHTVGPVWEGGVNNEEVMLRNSYRNSLKLAHQLECESISFPLISTGIFGYPKEAALRIAISEIEVFLIDHEMHVYLVVFDKQSFGISEKLYQSIAAFIDENEVTAIEKKDSRYRRVNEPKLDLYPQLEENRMEAPIDISLEDFFEDMDESFLERLLRFIDEKGMTDTATYRKANIDRRLFSKIRNSPGYMPMKKTIVAFAIALELDLHETDDLLEKAGYRLSRSQHFDLIIIYFIERKMYNIHEINNALFAFDQTLLGA